MPSSVRNRNWLLAKWALYLFGIFLTLPLSAVGETGPGPGDYLIKTWNAEDSLSGSTVTAIIQTPDGYLWVGTYEGLIRFDGVHSQTFDAQNQPALSHSRIQGLYLDARGTLWINTYRGGLTSYRDGVFRREWPDQAYFDLHTTMVSSTSNEVTFVTQFGEVLQGTPDGTNTTWKVINPQGTTRPIFQCADKDGTLWFVSRDRRIMQVRKGGAQYESLPTDGGLGDKRVYALAADANGEVWGGVDNRIVKWDGSRFVNMTPTNMDTADKTFAPTMLFPTSKGAIWVLANDRLREMIGRRWTAEPAEWRGLLGFASGRAMGVHEDSAGGVWFNHYGNGVFYVSPDGSYRRFTVESGLPGDRVGAWYQDRDNGVWLGVDRGGLVRLAKKRFQVIGAAEGLPPCPVLSVCQDSSNIVWFGTTAEGLYGYQNGKLKNYPVSDSAAANLVYSIFPRGNGDLWLSAGDGEDLFEYHDGQVQRSPLAVHGVKSLLIDHAGRLWAGTKINVGWYTTTSRHVFGTTDGVAETPVRCLAEAPDGTIWSGADDGTLYRCDPAHVQAFQPKDDVGAHPIWSLLVDPDGTVWAGTFRGGLLRFKDGKFTRFTTKQGLPMDSITQILEDRQNRLWLGTRQGIWCVDKAVLNAYADGKAETVDVVRHLNGPPTVECSDGYQPACWSAADGRLWFASVEGAVAVDPRALAVSSQPPPVIVEDMQVDGQSAPIGKGKVVVPPGHEQFEFRFTALGFDSPELSRFRYKIVGLDTKWVEADTRRVADYANLSPNHYRFQVIACNSDGVWNRTGATVDFTVQPHFYETRSFIILASVFVLSSVALIVRTVATRKYRAALARLAQQHAIEQDRSRIAKDIHDDIGAGLTQITLLSELGRRDPGHAGAQLERISDAARDLTRAMDEIVWAVDPQRDTLASLMDYISAYAEDFLRSAGIRCRMDFPAALPAMQIDAELRYNLFLALKEVLNNVVKHAQATEVWLHLQLDAKGFKLGVEDNGHGFEAANGANGAKNTTSVDRHNSGLGLPNLKKRLEAIGGQCRMESAPGKGTRVEMVVNFNGAISPVMAIGANGLTK